MCLMRVAPNDRSVFVRCTPAASSEMHRKIIITPNTSNPNPNRVPDTLARTTPSCSKPYKLPPCTSKKQAARSSPAKRKGAPVNKELVKKRKAQPEPTKKPRSREVASLACRLSSPTNERRTSAKKLAPATKKSATAKAAQKSASAAMEQISNAPVKSTPTRANASVQRGIGGAAELEEFDSTELREKHKYRDDGRAYMWCDADEDAGDMKVISYAAQMKGHDLSDRKITGKAALAFKVQYKEEDNYVGYIAGNLRLPPKGIKDSEGVGACSQIFTVCKCQPKALEVAYRDPDSSENEVEPASAQRYLLSPGDMFQLPPGNFYRLENHSTSTESLITWTIIRPKTSQTTN